MQVGCGAIGCEMLKNYAMLGVGRKPDGQVMLFQVCVAEFCSKIHLHVHVTRPAM